MVLRDSDDARLDYYGVKPCGCATAWMHADFITKTELKQFEREMKKTGRTVERAPFDRERIVTDCPHDSAAYARDVERERDELLKENERLRDLIDGEIEVQR